MKKMAIVLCLLFTFSKTYAQEKNESIYLNFASCTSTLDGVAVQLDFFKEYTEAGKATGAGMYLQTIGGEKGFKSIGKLKVATGAEANEIQMFTILSPATLFSKFELPKKLKDSPLEIFAITFGKTWGSFICNGTIGDLGDL
jgi:hypothetical protein